MMMILCFILLSLKSSYQGRNFKIYFYKLATFFLGSLSRPRLAFWQKILVNLLMSFCLKFMSEISDLQCILKPFSLN